MPFYIAYAIQLVLIIHVLKTGRDRYWVWLLLMLPGIGGLAYLIVELIPEFSGSIRGQRTARNVKNALDPGGDIRAASHAYEQAPTAENARWYGQALLARECYAEAENVLQQVTRGFHDTDPVLLELTAQAQFGQQRYQPCIATLDALTENNPEHSSANGHLLYARALEAHGQTDKALQEYAAVSKYYPGAEARVRYCEALLKAGRQEQALEQLDALEKDAKTAPKHFVKAQKQWLNRARDLR